MKAPMPSAVEAAVESYIRASTERDPALRTKLVEACIAPEIRIVTRSRELRGRAALLEEMARFLGNAEFSGIRILSVIDAGGTTFRFRSCVVHRDGREDEFFDAGEIDETGRIALLLLFAGPLADADAATRTRTL
jgi:hypothetical protein